MLLSNDCLSSAELSCLITAWRLTPCSVCRNTGNHTSCSRGMQALSFGVHGVYACRNRWRYIAAKTLPKVSGSWLRLAHLVSWLIQLRRHPISWPHNSSKVNPTAWSRRHSLHHLLRSPQLPILPVCFCLTFELALHGCMSRSTQVWA
jgi:hypothetical protein